MNSFNKQLSVIYKPHNLREGNGFRSWDKQLRKVSRSKLVKMNYR